MPQTLLGRPYSKTIIWQGDPTSAPANASGPAPTTLVVTPPVAPAQRGTVLLAAASADILFGGTTIVSPFTPAAVVAAPIISTNPAVPVVNVGAPVPFTLVQSPPGPLRAPPVATILKGDPTSAPPVSFATPSPLIVRPHRGRQAYCVWFTHGGVSSSSGSLPTPLLPLSLILDAHALDLALDAHQTNLTLDN